MARDSSRPHVSRADPDERCTARQGRGAVPPGSFSATFGTTGQCRAPCHPHQCSQPPLPHQSQLLCVSHGASHLLAWCLQLPPLVPCSGGVSQMGTLISLDCLLHQLKTERVLDVYGVTLQLTRSCCLMTPTLVGGKEGGQWAGQEGTSVPSCPQGPAPLHGLRGALLPASPSLWLCQPPRAKGAASSQGRACDLLSFGVSIG